MASKLIFFVGVAATLSTSVVWSADFRDNDWGASPEAVRAKEGEGTTGLLSPSGWGDKEYISVIGYDRVKHLGVDATVLFRFTPEEKLGNGFCVSRLNDISSFHHWEEAISASYGEPDNRDDILINDEDLLTRHYRGDAAAVEEGILKGYFALVRYWQNEKTYIWLVAELSDNALEVHIHYYSKEYFDFFREEKKQGGGPNIFRPYFDD